MTRRSVPPADPEGTEDWDTCPLCGGQWIKCGCDPDEADAVWGRRAHGGTLKGNRGIRGPISPYPWADADNKRHRHCLRKPSLSARAQRLTEPVAPHRIRRTASGSIATPYATESAGSDAEGVIHA